MSNQNTTTISPSNYYGTTGQPGKAKNNKLAVIILTILGILIVGAVITTTVVSNLDNDNDTSGRIIKRENSPTLELYAELEEEMTLASLQEKTDKAGANITVEDGAGTIMFPDDPDDMIFFYIDRKSDSYIDNNEAINEEEDYTVEDEEYVALTLEGYNPEDITYYFRFAHRITGSDNTDDDETEEENIGIAFVEASEDDEEEEEGYEVYDGYEFFMFPTKEEAIKAYLSPDSNK